MKVVTVLLTLGLVFVVTYVVKAEILLYSQDGLPKISNPLTEVNAAITSILNKLIEFSIRTGELSDQNWAYLTIPPLPENECGGPQANGLTSVVNGFSDAFPTYEFLGIFLEAVSDDEEVANVVSMLMTDEFDRFVYKVGEIDEWNELTDFICDDLQFNINFYLNVFGELIKLIPVDPTAPKSTTRSRPSIAGLVQEIIEILPLDEWKLKFKDLSETNTYVQRAIATVKGESFGIVANRTIEMNEFKVLSQNLRNLGLPVDCSVANLQKILGWAYDKCSCGGGLDNECL